ncbi:hypothetical protein SS50377_23399 [Spironucleus salmonicida]|uniref:Uncharacterized protein n=1 Tax=Spironucleus salmonicida TaxID=348837 RepID=V6LRS3_9EUKA|nr:hypothetical protein SS50377_23399 [Spironucleus salmonicida]|eukprot:EST47270.1 Hypothetical protein SS50377_12780 [Spironucleus salmonicida]
MEISMEALTSTLPDDIELQNQSLKIMLLSILAKYNQQIQEIQLCKQQILQTKSTTPVQSLQQEFQQQIYSEVQDKHKIQSQYSELKQKFEVLTKDNENMFQTIQKAQSENSYLKQQLTIQQPVQQQQFIPYNDIFNSKDDFEQLKLLAKSVADENTQLLQQIQTYQYQIQSNSSEQKIQIARLHGEISNYKEKIKTYEEQLMVIQYANSNENIEKMQSEIDFVKDKLLDTVSQLNQNQSEYKAKLQQQQEKSNENITKIDQKHQINHQNYQKEVIQLHNQQKQIYKLEIKDLTSKNTFYLQEQLKDKETLFDIKQQQVKQQNELNAQIALFSTAKQRAKARYETLAIELEKALDYISELKIQNLTAHEQTMKLKTQLIEVETQNKLMRNSYDNILQMPFQRQEIPLILRQIQLNSALQATENMKHQELVTRLKDESKAESQEIKLNSSELECVKEDTLKIDYKTQDESASDQIQDLKLIFQKYQIILSDIIDLSETLSTEYEYYVQINIMDQVFVSQSKLPSAGILCIEFNEKLQFNYQQNMEFSNQLFTIQLFQILEEQSTHIEKVELLINDFYNQQKQTLLTTGKLEIEIKQIDQ